MEMYILRIIAIKNGWLMKIIFHIDKTSNCHRCLVWKLN